MSSEIHGMLHPDQPIKIHTLTNGHGLEARVSEWGATLVSFRAPDRDGLLADLTLGYDDLDGWMSDSAYFGATVGRFANRIAQGAFTLDGTSYQLARNAANGNHLHGGICGFNKRIWPSRVIDENSVEFSLLSPDGEEGYPGNLNVRVIYRLTDENELIWDATATTDAPTIINLAHHTYWNLGGDPSRPVTEHELTIDAPHFLPTAANMIPTGEIRSVSDTPMDFTTPHRVGERIDADYAPLRIAGGYDHCWVLEQGGGLRRTARLYEPASGRVMEVFTDQPGIQFYTANFLDGGITGKKGIAYPKRSGLCLETQNFPDAPNHPSFPSCILRPGETYHHRMMHRFSTA